MPISVILTMDISTTNAAAEASHIPDGITPVTPAAFHILLALLASASHGYAIMQKVERLTGGRVKIGNATLYRSIQKLAVDGLVEEFSDPAAEGDERRREYRLTPLGLRVARSEAMRLHMLVQVARRLGLLSEKRTAHPARPNPAASRAQKARTGDRR